MKYIGLPAIFLFATAVYAQTDKQELDLQEMALTYTGYNAELSMYLFSDTYEDEGTIVEDNYEFIFINEKVETKFDLKSEQFEGQLFKLTYTVEVATRLDEEGEEEFYEIYTIYSIDLHE